MRLVSVALDRPVTGYCEPTRRCKSSVAGLRILDQQAQYQATALKNANKTTQLATVPYEGGLAAVIEVIDTQRTSLQAPRQALVATTQMLPTVALINAGVVGTSSSSRLPPRRSRRGARG